MVKRLELSDIPLWVLKDIYRKWSLALEEGWEDSLWIECSLCSYCKKRVNSSLYYRCRCKSICDICPLPPTRFCMSGISSKLHIKAHNSEEEWKQAVEEFLKFLSQEMNKRSGMNESMVYMVRTAIKNS